MFFFVVVVFSLKMCHQGIFLSQSLVVFKEFINVLQVEFEPSQQNEKTRMPARAPTKNKTNNNTHTHARAHTHTNPQAQATLAQAPPPGRCMTRPNVQFLTGTSFVRGRGGERDLLSFRGHFSGGA